MCEHALAGGVVPAYMGTAFAVTVTPKPGMERAGTAMVMAPDTAGMTRGFGAGAEEARTSRQARTN